VDLILWPQARHFTANIYCELQFITGTTAINSNNGNVQGLIVMTFISAVQFIDSAALALQSQHNDSRRVVVDIG